MNARLEVVPPDPELVAGLLAKMAAKPTNWARVAREAAKHLEFLAWGLEAKDGIPLTKESRLQSERELEAVWAIIRNARGDADARAVLHDLVSHALKKRAEEGWVYSDAMTNVSEDPLGPCFIADEFVIEHFAEPFPEKSEAIHSARKEVVALLEASKTRGGRGKWIDPKNKKGAVMNRLLKKLGLPASTSGAVRARASRRKSAR